MSPTSLPTHPPHPRPSSTGCHYTLLLHTSYTYSISLVPPLYLGPFKLSTHHVRPSMCTLQNHLNLQLHFQLVKTLHKSSKETTSYRRKEWYSNMDISLRVTFHERKCPYCLIETDDMNEESDKLRDKLSKGNGETKKKGIEGVFQAVTKLNAMGKAMNECGDAVKILKEKDAKAIVFEVVKEAGLFEVELMADVRGGEEAEEVGDGVTAAQKIDR